MSIRSGNIALTGALGILTAMGVQCSDPGNEDTPVERGGSERPSGGGSLGGNSAERGGGGSRQGTGGDSGRGGASSTVDKATAGGGSGGETGGTSTTRVQSAGGAGTNRDSGVGGRGGGGGSTTGRAGANDAGLGGGRVDGTGRGGASGTGGRSGAGGGGGSSGVGNAGSSGAGGARVRGAGGAGRAGNPGSTGAAGAITSVTGDDGCTDTPASNLTLQQVAAYQSVKIPLMTNGTEVALASRVSTMIAGRQTLFRVFVTPGSGWSARELSARLTLTASGGDSVQYYAKKSISKTSTDADRDSTFEILVPATGLTESLRYSLQVVECGSQSEASGQARFPTTGDADLGVKKTGALKVKVIPMQVNNLLPDTSQAALDAYAKELMSMYPIDSVDITVGDTLTTTSPLAWETMVDQIRAKRQKDKPGAEYYYFGLVKPAATLTAYCKSSCILGVGLVVTTGNSTAAYGRAAVGVAFGDQHSLTTMTHEIGHNHGRQHSPCAPSGGNISGVDSLYPYAKAALGTWGWDCDKNALYDPAKATDIMGYCENQWISDYTYNGLITRVSSVTGAKSVLTPPNAVGRWRVMLLGEGQAPRWGVPIDEDTAADGSPETATIYNESGMVLTTVTVYRIPFSDISGSMVLIPAPAPDWYSVEVGGAVPHRFAAPVTVPIP